MSQQLINHSQDLKKLRNEGYEIQIIDGYLLIHHVPYFNSNKNLKYGTIVSDLTLSGNRTARPNNHVVYFIGEHPCNKEGTPIVQIQHSSSNRALTNSITINHSFSNKPKNGYANYYDKMTRYIEIISAPAVSMDSSVTAKTFKIITSHEQGEVFNYYDTNTSRANISIANDKLKNHKIAIIGLGGTGSYILDLLSKTPVEEIHLFDKDDFLQHNAFRSPGAASIEILEKQPNKCEYYAKLYSNMHKSITPHPYHITADNIEVLKNMDFIFISIDKGEVKEQIISFLEQNDTTFVDVGIGVQMVDSSLIGIVRTTMSTPEKRDHVHLKNRIPFYSDENNKYSQNIQIAELNALNATLAVIKWKKYYGFYQDFENEHFSAYTINTNQLLSEDCKT